MTEGDAVDPHCGSQRATPYAAHSTQREPFVFVSLSGTHPDQFFEPVQQDPRSAHETRCPKTNLDNVSADRLQVERPVEARYAQHFGNRCVEADREVLEDVIERDPTVIEPYVDVAKLRTVYRGYVSDPMAATDGDLFTIFLSASLAIWLRRANLAP